MPKRENIGPSEEEFTILKLGNLKIGVSRKYETSCDRTNYFIVLSLKIVFTVLL